MRIPVYDFCVNQENGIEEIKGVIWEYLPAAVFIPRLQYQGQAFFLRYPPGRINLRCARGGIHLKSLVRNVAVDDMLPYAGLFRRLTGMMAPASR